MQPLIIGAVAVIAGVLLGYWLNGMFGQSEKAQLERRAQELAGELGAVRAELARVQADAAAHQRKVPKESTAVLTMLAALFGSATES